MALERIAQVLGVRTYVVEEAVQKLQKKYNTPESGIHLLFLGDSAQFTVYRDGEDVTLNITFDESSQQRQQDLNDLRARLVEEQQAQREQENQQNGYFSWPFGW